MQHARRYFNSTFCAPTATWQSRLLHVQHIAVKFQDMWGIRQWLTLCVSAVFSTSIKPVASFRELLKRRSSKISNVSYLTMPRSVTAFPPKHRSWQSKSMRQEGPLFVGNFHKPRHRNTDWIMRSPAAVFYTARANTRDNSSTSQ